MRPGRLWVGTPLSDQRWAQALQIFEQELGDQGAGAKRHKARPGDMECLELGLLQCCGKY